MSSTHDNFPKDYKFCGFNLMMNGDGISTNRKVYNILNVLADVGGLKSSLTIIFATLVSIL